VSGFRYQRSTRVLTRTFAGQVILAAPDGDAFEVLSGTARTVWELLEEARPLDEVVGLLAEAYGASPHDIASDVDNLLEELSRRGCLERLDG
jgi:hypothetical protein